MTDPSSSVIHSKQGKNTGLLSKTYVVDKSNLNYLAHCFTRACSESGKGLKVSILMIILRVLY